MHPTWMVFVRCVFILDVWEYSQLRRAKKTDLTRRKVVARSCTEPKKVALWIWRKMRGRHGLLVVGWRVVAVVVGELCADVGIELTGLGVVEGVSGLTIVDEDLCDVSDGGLDRSNHDLLAVG